MSATAGCRRFPNAEYLFGREEWDFWKNEEVDPFGREARGDSIEPIIESGLAQLVETDHRVTSEVSLVPTPGHTPGRVSVLIESAGERAIITGDLFHHPAQFAHPTWQDVADVDTAHAADVHGPLQRRNARARRSRAGCANNGQG